MKQNIIDYKNTGNLLDDACNIINSSQNFAYQSINLALVERNWYIGYRLACEEIKEEKRADYGLEIVKNISKDLTQKYGKGFDKSNLYHYLRFYKTFPDFNKLIENNQKSILTWSHYRILLQVLDNTARNWYLNEAIRETWSTRTLQRNIDSQYYYRLLKSQVKEPVIDEMKKNNNSNYKLNKLEFIKNHVIAEFLGLDNIPSFTETELESSIITNLQKFLIELGKGYAFVARQQHIHTEKEDYFIDLVFYNYILKCFVLIDLKAKKITHQDVGQMDMYVRMYDELKKAKDDNPTIGILLCSETDEDIARYSILKGNEQLFATKYKLYLPTEEELKQEIEIQKNIFRLQQEDNK